MTGGGGVALLAFLESGESLRMNVRGEERRRVSVCAVALLVSRCGGPTFRMHILTMLWWSVRLWPLGF